MSDRQRVLDSHAHAFPDRIAAGAIEVLTAEALWMPVQAHHDGTVAGLLGCMDDAGIDRVILCSVATRPAQVPKITDWSASIAGERVIPFASIHPGLRARGSRGRAGGRAWHPGAQVPSVLHELPD
jgi:hypothetical protein